MKTRNAIWKKKIPVQGPGMFPVELPFTAKILDVQKQGNDFVMWFWLDLESANYMTTRYFTWIMTGQEFTAHKLEYVKTIQDGPLVFHLHEVLP